MATAVVSAAVALMMDEHDYYWPGAPRLTPNAIKGILQYTAIAVPGADAADAGHGRTERRRGR